MAIVSGLPEFRIRVPEVVNLESVMRSNPNYDLIEGRDTDAPENSETFKKNREKLVDINSKAQIWSTVEKYFFMAMGLSTSALAGGFTTLDPSILWGLGGVTAALGSAGAYCSYTANKIRVESSFDNGEVNAKRFAHYNAKAIVEELEHSHTAAPITVQEPYALFENDNVPSPKGVMYTEHQGHIVEAQQRHIQ